jgi:hypothetical protein
LAVKPPGTKQKTNLNLKEVVPKVKILEQNFLSLYGASFTPESDSIKSFFTLCKTISGDPQDSQKGFRRELLSHAKQGGLLRPCRYQNTEAL